MRNPRVTLRSDERKCKMLPLYLCMFHFTDRVRVPPLLILAYIQMHKLYSPVQFCSSSSRGGKKRRTQVKYHDQRHPQNIQQSCTINAPVARTWYYNMSYLVTIPGQLNLGRFEEINSVIYRVIQCISYFQSNGGHEQRERFSISCKSIKKKDHNRFPPQLQLPPEYQVMTSFANLH